MAKKDPYLEDRKLIMHQFSQHTQALGGLTQEVRGLRDDVIAIKTETKIEAKKDAKKTTYLAVILSVLLSSVIALAL